MNYVIKRDSFAKYYQPKMTVSYNRKQLTIDTVFEEDLNALEHTPIIQIRQEEEDQSRPFRLEPFCKKNDNFLKIITIVLCLLLLLVQTTVDWYFEIPYFRFKAEVQFIIHASYAFVVINSDMNDICNIKNSTTKVMAFCKYVNYLEWIVAYVNALNALLLSFEQFIQYGAIMHPPMVCASIVKIIIYVLVMRNNKTIF